MTDAEIEETGPTEPQSRNIIYCGVCHLPPEYCEFGGTVKKCQEWLLRTHVDIYNELWSEERSKRKFVTIVAGLEAFSLENKKVAKDFGKKFATGSSVTKTPSGGEEIVVQGDLSEEIEEFILEKYSVIPGDNIELIEDMKKKNGGSGVGGG
ncbi:Translation machinery-associated protein 22 [Golovinomyces cichoracearum]|uniref:Translation machinery-associated protein 22 n=1 Tax=Golovinomyces cichoracearum TaxID=62708 RepID=A0A420I794_9PEZI|nr:Translation machinery-associated protein 22 [Golovinomyces cichoracearum]